MKKIILILSLVIGSGIICIAQQDPEAKKILDRVSAKAKQYTTVRVDFELVIENRREAMTSNSKGSLLIKNEKYYMETEGSKVYYNGETLWTYMEDIHEVTLTNPDKTSADFIENPTAIFDFYNRDFKYKLVGETKLEEGWMYEIDLFPNDLNQPYSRFKVYISRDKDELHRVSAIAKDGVDYTAVLRNHKYNETIPDSQFSFDISKYNKLEVVDLRF